MKLCDQFRIVETPFSTFYACLKHDNILIKIDAIMSNYRILLCICTLTI